MARNKGYTVSQLLEALWGLANLKSKVRIQGADGNGEYRVRSIIWDGKSVSLSVGGFMSTEGRGYSSLKTLLFDLMQRDPKVQVLVGGYKIHEIIYTPSKNTVLFTHEG